MHSLIVKLLIVKLIKRQPVETRRAWVERPEECIGGAVEVEENDTDKDWKYDRIANIGIESRLFILSKWEKLICLTVILALFRCNRLPHRRGYLHNHSYPWMTWLCDCASRLAPRERVETLRLKTPWYYFLDLFKENATISKWMFWNTLSRNILSAFFDFTTVGLRNVQKLLITHSQVAFQVSHRWKIATMWLGTKKILYDETVDKELKSVQIRDSTVSMNHRCHNARWSKQLILQVT